MGSTKIGYPKLNKFPEYIFYMHHKLWKTLLVHIAMHHIGTSPIWGHFCCDTEWSLIRGSTVLACECRCTECVWLDAHLVSTIWKSCSHIIFRGQIHWPKYYKGIWMLLKYYKGIWMLTFIFIVFTHVGSVIYCPLMLAYFTSRICEAWLTLSYRGVQVCGKRAGRLYWLLSLHTTLGLRGGGGVLSILYMFAVNSANPFLPLLPGFFQDIWFRKYPVFEYFLSHKDPIYEYPYIPRFIYDLYMIQFCTIIISKRLNFWKSSPLGPNSTERAYLPTSEVSIP